METRKDALDWWKNKSLEHKKIAAREWQTSLEPNSFRKSWAFEMIDASSSTIESIFVWTKNK